MTLAVGGQSGPEGMPLGASVWPVSIAASERREVREVKPAPEREP